LDQHQLDAKIRVKLYYVAGYTAGTYKLKVTS